MMRALRAAALLAAWLMAGAALAAGPAVRVQVPLQQPVLVGQQVPIEVTVAAPNFFLSAPPFPVLDVQGAIVTLSDERSVHGVEQDGGQTIATIQRHYVFTAQQPGDFELPAAKIEFSYQGDDGKPQQASLALPATRITARLPAGASPAAAGAAVMPATRLSIRQSVDRDAGALSAGDALVRTVEIQAANTPAMLIPPPHFEAPDDVRRYQADRVLRDLNGEGGSSAGGQRVERVTYVFEKPGRYTLPAVQVQWLDPQTQKPATGQAPALTVQVKAGAHVADRIAPELPVGAAPAKPRKLMDWVRLGIWMAGFGLLLLLAWWGRRRWPRWRVARAERQAALAQSDAVMFERVLAACQAGDANAAHSALLAWSRAHAQSTPQAWAASLEDPATAMQVELLGRHLYRSGAQDGWSGGACAQALKAGRQQWRRRSDGQERRAGWGRSLGPLN